MEKKQKHRDNLAVGAKVKAHHDERKRADAVAKRPYKPAAAPPPAARATIGALKRRLAQDAGS